MQEQEQPQFPNEVLAEAKASAHGLNLQTHCLRGRDTNFSVAKERQLQGSLLALLLVEVAEVVLLLVEVEEVAEVVLLQVQTRRRVVQVGRRATSLYR